MLSGHSRVGEEDDTLPDPGWRAKVAMDLAEIELFGSRALARAGQAVVGALQRLEGEAASVGSMVELDEAVASYRELPRDSPGRPRASGHRPANSVVRHPRLSRGSVTSAEQQPSTGDQLRAALGLGIPLEVVEAAAALAPLGGPFAEVARLRDQYEAMICDAATHLDVLTARGWGLVSMPTPSLSAASDLANAGEGEAADALLAEIWEDDSRTGRVVARVGGLGTADGDMRAMAHQRRRLLLKARAHHHAGAYEASVPMLLSSVEGITADVTDKMFFSTSPRNQADVGDPTRLVAIPAALPALRGPYVAGLHRTQAAGSLSRHGILHGRELAYDTKITSAKCWSLLDAVCEWAMPLARAIAEERVADARARRAGSDRVNGRGQRYDDREFMATRESLRLVSTRQLSEHRRRASFHPSVLTALGPSAFARYGLPEPHGMHSVVSPEGQAWWAWRVTVSGWVLGSALVAQDAQFVEYLYAGAKEPADSPTDAPETWGAPWSTPPDWTSFEGTGD